MDRKAKTLILGIVLAFCGCAGSSCSANAADVMPERLVVGTSCDFQPFDWSTNVASEFTAPIENHYGTYADGYDIAIAKEIGKYLDMEVVVIQIPFEALIPDLATGAMNMMMAGISETEERGQVISFSDEYYRSELVLVVEKEVAEWFDGPLSEDEFAALVDGWTLISQVGTATDDISEYFETAYGAIHGPALPTFGACALDISAPNGADAMVAERPVAESLVETYTNLGIIRIDQSILGEEGSQMGVSIGIRKGMDTFKEKLNEALATISQERRDSLMEGCLARSSAE